MGAIVSGSAFFAFSLVAQLPGNAGYSCPVGIRMVDSQGTSPQNTFQLTPIAYGGYGPGQ